MRMALLLLVLVCYSCNSETEIVCPAAAEKVQTLITGFAILEDDFLISNLDGVQTLTSENLEFGFSHGDGILWLKSERYQFSAWRNVRVGFEVNEDVCFHEISYNNLAPNYTEIQFSNELSDFIYNNPDQRIFFHLNLEI